jgi:hypothetical protein
LYRWTDISLLLLDHGSVDVGGATGAMATRENYRGAFRYALAGLLTVAGSVLLCGILVLSQWVGAGSDDRARPTATPRPITRSAVLLVDGVTIVYSDPDGSCRGPVLGIAETPTRVVLSLSETDAGLADCVRSGDLGRPTKAQLASPLGSRPLVDQATGDAVPYFDQSRGLHLLAVPAEWFSMGDTPYGSVTTDTPYFGGAGAGVIVETYVGFNESRHLTGARLQIIQVAGGGWHPPLATVTTPVTVRGQAGLAAAGIIVWAESGMTVAVTGYGPPPPSRDPLFMRTGAPLTTEALIKIADTLRVGGS